MSALPSPPTGRLAPTPSGHLHLGNVVAFLVAWLSVRSRGGRLLYRVEDTDRARARREVEEGQRRDLSWLGLGWDEEVPAQSTRDYEPWLARLPTYRCVCTRKDAAEGYPNTCRDAGHREGKVRLRLPPGELTVVDRRWGTRRLDPNAFGDPVVKRADGVTAYPLAVVVDDLVDGVTEVVRGSDLLEFTAVQVRLWEAFAATPPTWLHAPLILGPDGRKLSKSHGSAHLGALRDAGWRPADVWRAVLPWIGLPGDSLEEATRRFDPRAGPRGPIQLLSTGAPGRLEWRPAP